MSKVRPSSTVEGVSNELTKADKMEVIDMAALAKLCYFREDCLIELDKRRKDHEEDVTSTTNSTTSTSYRRVARSREGTGFRRDAACSERTP